MYPATNLKALKFSQSWARLLIHKLDSDYLFGENGSLTMSREPKKFIDTQGRAGYMDLLYSDLSKK